MSLFSESTVVNIIVVLVLNVVGSSLVTISYYSGEHGQNNRTSAAIVGETLGSRVHLIGLVLFSYCYGFEKHHPTGN